jgi:hypothetical protein
MTFQDTVTVLGLVGGATVGIASFIKWWISNKHKGREMRPYLSILPVKVTEQSENNFFRFRLLQHNKGKTPARRVTCYASMQLVRWEIMGQHDFPLFPHDDSSTTSIGPDEKWFEEIVPDKRISEKDLAELKKSQGLGPRRLCLWGVIEYEDDAKGNYFNEFCYYVSWESGSPRLSLSKFHNDSN